MARFMQKLLYASDEEWSRYLAIYFIFGAILCIFNFIEYFQYKDDVNFFETQLKVKYPNATQCIILYQVNLWSNFVNMIMITFVCGFQMFLILNDYVRFFYLKQYQIASYEDKDIEVYSI
jgi:hypothetical protein